MAQVGTEWVPVVCIGLGRAGSQAAKTAVAMLAQDAKSRLPDGQWSTEVEERLFSAVLVESADAAVRWSVLTRATEASGLSGEPTPEPALEVSGWSEERQHFEKQGADVFAKLLREVRDGVAGQVAVAQLQAAGITLARATPYIAIFGTTFDRAGSSLLLPVLKILGNEAADTSSDKRSADQVDLFLFLPAALENHRKDDEAFRRTHACLQEMEWEIENAPAPGQIDDPLVKPERIWLLDGNDASGRYLAPFTDRLKALGRVVVRLAPNPPFVRKLWQRQQAEPHLLYGSFGYGQLTYPESHLRDTVREKFLRDAMEDFVEESPDAGVVNATILRGNVNAAFQKADLGNIVPFLQQGYGVEGRTTWGMEVEGPGIGAGVEAYTQLVDTEFERLKKGLDGEVAEVLGRRQEEWALSRFQTILDIAKQPSPLGPDATPFQVLAYPEKFLFGIADEWGRVRAGSDQAVAENQGLKDLLGKVTISLHEIFGHGNLGAELARAETDLRDKTAALQDAIARQKQLEDSAIKIQQAQSGVGSSGKPLQPGVSGTEPLVVETELGSKHLPEAESTLEGHGAANRASLQQQQQRVATLTAECEELQKKLPDLVMIYKTLTDAVNDATAVRERLAELDTKKTESTTEFAQKANECVAKIEEAKATREQLLVHEKQWVLRGLAWCLSSILVYGWTWWKLGGVEIRLALLSQLLPMSIAFATYVGYQRTAGAPLDAARVARRESKSSIWHEIAIRTTASERIAGAGLLATLVSAYLIVLFWWRIGESELRFALLTGLLPLAGLAFVLFRLWGVRNQLRKVELEWLDQRFSLQKLGESIRKTTEEALQTRFKANVAFEAQKAIKALQDRLRAKAEWRGTFLESLRKKLGGIADTSGPERAALPDAFVWRLEDPEFVARSVAGTRYAQNLAEVRRELKKSIVEEQEFHALEELLARCTEEALPEPVGLLKAITQQAAGPNVAAWCEGVQPWLGVQAISSEPYSKISVAQVAHPKKTRAEEWSTDDKKRALGMAELEIVEDAAGDSMAADIIVFLCTLGSQNLPVLEAAARRMSQVESWTKYYTVSDPKFLPWSPLRGDLADKLQPGYRDRGALKLALLLGVLRTEPNTGNLIWADGSSLNLTPLEFLQKGRVRTSDGQSPTEVLENLLRHELASSEKQALVAAALKNPEEIHRDVQDMSAFYSRVADVA